MRAHTPSRAIPSRFALVVAALSLLLPIGWMCTTASAALRPMVPIWQENFEDGQANGWMLEKFQRGDKIGVVPADQSGLSGGAASFAAVPNGYVLMAQSQSTDNGAGYRGQSPSFEQMGLDRTEPYRISFRYGIPATARACWTYALMTPYVSLLVVECNPATGMALLAAIDDLDQRVTPLTWFPLGQWMHVEVLVEPTLPAGTATVTVRLDGGIVGELSGLREIVSRDRLVFMDLPVKLYDVDDPPANADCFGSGVWDDVQLARQVPPPPRPPRDIDFTISPNPFNPNTVVELALPDMARVDVRVFDLSGRYVCTLYQGDLGEGLHALPWNGRDAGGREVASGVYLIRASVGAQMATGRAVLVR